MPIGIHSEHHELAEAARGFARRHGPVTATREQLSAPVSGRPTSWAPLLDQRLHSIHLSEDVGGDGGSIEDLAVVAEALGSELLPGPWLPTVIASATLATAAPSDDRDAALRRFADGVTGAVVSTGDTLTCTAVDGGWTLDGTADVVLGAMSAEVLLVRAVHGPETAWFVVDAEAAGITREERDATDLTRDIGRVSFSGVKSPQPVAGLSDVVAHGVMTTLLAAETVGVLGWGVSTALEYAKVRHQFGVPIGSFQAVKHKLALLFITTEMAGASAWDAARALVSPDEDQVLLASESASLMVLDKAVDALTDVVTTLGGIGFTWEHDAHLYLRRAISAAALVGVSDDRAQRLGAMALGAERDFSLDLPDEDPQFRAWVSDVLDQALRLPEDKARSSGMAGLATGERRDLLAKNGLVSSHWPKPWGLGASPTQQVIIAEEYGRRQMAVPTTVIGEWAVPTILAHGSPEQHERFVPQSLRGEIVWCQLFSEPGAGSDLAGLSTKATKVDGGWRINGQKVWTSSAHEADWGVCLARTDPDVAKHKGISYFLVDMRSPGVEVRPLKMSTGQSEFNEVFLTDVFVPDDLLVGEPGQGWRLTVTTLANERLSIGTGLGVRPAQAVRVAVAEGTLTSSEAATRALLGRATAVQDALSAMHLRELLRRLSGLEPGAGGSVAKVASAVAIRDLAMEQLRAVGPEAAVQTAPAVQEVLGLPMQLIGGGTLEIQLNIISERILGLPR